jgi:phosphotransferase system HPr (HPr) family protein
MPTVNVTVQHEAGLHARPLAKFVKLAKSYDATIEVTNLTRSQGPVSGVSPVKLLLLAVVSGHELQISAKGPQADEALAALNTLVINNFEGDERGNVLDHRPGRDGQALV